MIGLVSQTFFFQFNNLQSKRGKFGACGFVVCVMNAVDSQTLRDLDKHGTVVNINHLTDRHLGDVQRHPKNILVRFAKVDETRGNKKIYKAVELESLDAMRVQLTSFVAD